MNKKLGFSLAALVLVGACAVVAFADMQSQKAPGTYTIVEDSTGTTSFILGKPGANISPDKDTSDTYDTFQWNHAVLQVKGDPRIGSTLRAAATAVDSGAAIVRTQGSNDRVFWKDIDTTTAADSLPVSEELWLKERTYRYVRWIVENTTKTDDSGVTVTLKLNAVKR